MKKGGKVIHLNQQQEKIEGKVIPFSVILTNSVYEIAEGDEGDFTEEMPTFEMEAAILGRDEDGDLGISWDFRFEHPGLFILEASYEGMVEITGNGTIDPEELGRQTAFPALTEFSLLIPALSRSLTGLPYTVGPMELLDLAGGLFDFDLDFDDEKPF